MTVALIGTPLAQDKEKAKEITASGEVLCAHCDLDVVSKCQKAIKVAEGKTYLLSGDKVTKFFKNKETKKAKEVKVTGTSTSKVKDYLVITATNIEEVTPEPAKEESKVITASGEVICAHCDLDVVSKCQKAIKTTEGKTYLLTGDKVTEFFKAKETKKAKEVKITGTSTSKVKEYLVITATKIEKVKAKK